jgi:hypothetical protein
MDSFREVTSQHVNELLRVELLQAFSKENKSYIGIMKTIKQLHKKFTKKVKVFDMLDETPPLSSMKVPETQLIIELVNCTFNCSP